MNTNEQTNTKAWLWLPTVYFTRGLPYVIVFLVSLVFFNRMGQSNSTITLITSWAFVTFIMRPLLGRFVTGYATKRLWVLAMELLMAVSMFTVDYHSLLGNSVYAVHFYNSVCRRNTRCGSGKIL